MEDTTEIKNDPMIEALFKAGAHFGYTRSRRHPTVAPYIFGVKNKVEIFDLEKTKTLLDDAKNFVSELGKAGKQILFVGGKNESQDIIKQSALLLEMPYISGRWIGGTLTNFGEIRSRVDRMLDLTKKKEKGELAKYTKKERLLMDREVVKLDILFGGLVLLRQMPSALFVIDPDREEIAVTEAHKMGIPVIGLLSSDCNLKSVDYPIVGNDSAVSSIKFFTNEIVSAYRGGKKSSPIKAEASK